MYDRINIGNVTVERKKQIKMIAYINGRLEVVNENAVIVEANGVGYEVICANPFRFQHQLGEKIRIHTFHYIREDVQILYGFVNPDEKNLFARILQVSGIGPKGALSIVGTAGVQDFVEAIETENEKFLTGFPGVGKKTARQMILDLKGKLIQEFDVTLSITDEKGTLFDSHNQEVLEEALEALRSLGYSERELKQITPELKKEKNANTDQYIRVGLALLTKK